MRSFVIICVLVTIIKLSLMRFYHSTDFEVHRNWLAITHSLPLDRWYTDTTSPWTLDYPPAFAYFEWALSQAARLFDAAMLDVNNLNYASPLTVLFQRLSVIGTDAVLMYGTYRFLCAWRRSTVGMSTTTARPIEGTILLAGAVLGNVGLLLVDHIHFQYNGVLFGLLLLSIAAVMEQRILLAAILFAVLLCMKHIFLYVAPVYGVYMLRFYVLGGSGGTGLLTRRQSLQRLITLALVVLAVATAVFAPFRAQIPQLGARLFPFKRGLTHAYWAPNVWALYNAADKLLAAGLRRSSTASAAGLVGQFEHAVLPSVSAWWTFVASTAAMVPCLWRLATQPWHRVETPRNFIRALVLCAGASFLFGWHVHEKAVLMMVIPLSLLCMADRHEARYTEFLSYVAVYSLFPLLDTANATASLTPIKYALWLLHASFMSTMIRRFHWRSTKATVEVDGRAWPERLYMVGFQALFFYEKVLHPALGLQERLPFVPLMLCSVYCAVGVLWFWLSYYWRFWASGRGLTKSGVQRTIGEKVK